MALHPVPAACLMSGNAALLIKSVPVVPCSQQETLHFYTPILENNARICRRATQQSRIHSCVFFFSCPQRQVARTTCHYLDVWCQHCSFQKVTGGQLMRGFLSLVLKLMGSDTRGGFAASPAARWFESLLHFLNRLLHRARVRNLHECCSRSPAVGLYGTQMFVTPGVFVKDGIIT